MELLKRLFVEEEGQGITEYALMLGLVILGIWVLVANTGIGNEVSRIFNEVNSAVAGCTSGSCP
jgi:pilus assembly protein Flp/PilA